GGGDDPANVAPEKEEDSVWTGAEAERSCWVVVPSWATGVSRTEFVFFGVGNTPGLPSESVGAATGVPEGDRASESPAWPPAMIPSSGGIATLPPSSVSTEK